MDMNWKKTGVFAAGVAFGTAGIKVLTSKDAKKLYTNCTAAVLRAKDFVMKTTTTLQENCEDIYNPFSLFNAFAQKKYANFWFSTGNMISTRRSRLRGIQSALPM